MEQNRQPWMEDGPPLAPFGDYLLQRKIAHGGMAEVFLGRHQEGDEDDRVVIKRILPELATDPRFVAMFINEAQLAAQMSHPNIVRVHDFGESDGRLFMAMEYVDGLDCWRFSRRLYPWGRDHTAIAVRVVSEVLDALYFVHNMTDVNGAPLEVVHRDLSPSNIYLSLDGEVKLGDFGIARIESPRYRRIAMIPKGKFGYMAPEQVEGLHIDARADIFSAGIVLAELLIRKKIFSGRSQLSVMLDIRDARLDTLEQNIDRIEPGLFEILQRALSRDPEQRYASASSFKLALDRYLEEGQRLPDDDDVAAQVRAAVELRSGRASLPRADDKLEELTPATAEMMAAATPVTVATPGLDGFAQPRSDKRTPVRVNLPRTGQTPAVGGFLNAQEGEDDGTPVTAEASAFNKEGQYAAVLDSGRTIGPTSYAHIIELVYSDKINAATGISVDGRPPIPAAELPELARHLPVYTPTRDLDGVDAPDRRGLLDMESTSQVILSLALREETGLFVCQSTRRRKEVYFREGRAIYVGSNEPGELLGEYLVANEIIGAKDLEIALALLPKFNGHLGDTLIALGVLSAVELFQHIREQILARFSELLSWYSGGYEFYRGATCRPQVLEVPFDPFEAVKGVAIERAMELSPFSIIDGLGSADIEESPDAAGLLEMLDLPEEFTQPLEQNPVPKRFDTWLSDCGEGAQQERAIRAFYIAVETGVWTLEGPLPPWRERD